MKTEEVISTIKNAAMVNNTISLLYTNSSDGIKPREVEPYSIKNGSFFAYDVKKEGIRNFKLDRVISVRETLNKFNPKWDFEFNA